MHKQPAVSVVIPCYNTHAYLNQTICSVRGQTFQNIEIIVIDDGSTDPATIDCLNHLGENVLVIHQSNQGLPAARNAGFAVARGEFVLPLDADDWLEPDAVEKLINVLKQSPEAGFSFSHICMEGEGQGVLTKHYNFFEQLFLNQLSYCLMLRKSLWQAAGGYDETMRRGYEDWEFNIRLGSMGCFGIVVPMPLFHYRVSRNGMLLRTSNKVHGEIWESIRHKHAEIYGTTNLFRLWREWRRHPSTYPLWLYFGWLTAAKLLPSRAFAALFRKIRRYSHGRRVTNAVTEI